MKTPNCLFLCSEGMEHSSKIVLEVVGSTEKALKLNTPLGFKWLPRSVIISCSHTAISGIGYLQVIQGWFLDKNPEWQDLIYTGYNCLSEWENNKEWNKLYPGM